MKKMLILFLGSLLLFQCKNSSNPNDSQTVTMVGIVKDAATLLPVDGVIVGFKRPEVDDQLLMTNDPNTLNGLTQAYTSSRQGNYELRLFPAPQPPPYQDIFAYKQGYPLWRYDPLRDTITVRDNKAFLNIDLPQE